MSGGPERRAETAAILLLLGAAASAAGFVVVDAIDGLPHRVQFEGLTLGGALGLIAAALIVIAKRLVPDEEEPEAYPDAEHADEQAAVEQLVEEGGSRITRKRMLAGAGGAAAGALGLAALAPATSLGPAFDMRALYETPWRPGRRLVDESGRPYTAEDIFAKSFYTAYPEGGSKEEMGAPVVVVRLALDQLRLPPERAGWAPEGILAYSKICTHAGCAIALYRAPLFPPTEPKPGLVCPCHYSTFDPARAGAVTFGPAGRPLPQLPLTIDSRRGLRAGGNFSGPVGPSWWGVRSGKPR
jgi:ubiquinol-cytochrome c reductase iron-sulfur subunit